VDDHPEPPAAVTMRRLEDQLTWYDTKAGQSQKAYKRLKLAQLVVGATVPVVAALALPAAVTATLAALVVLAEGIQQLNQWQTNWILYRSTAEVLQREKFLYYAEAGPYKSPDRDSRLAERVDDVLSRETLKWFESHRGDVRHHQ
jgi:hypothetical protein